MNVRGSSLSSCNSEIIHQMMIKTKLFVINNLEGNYKPSLLLRMPLHSSVAQRLSKIRFAP